MNINYNHPTELRTNNDGRRHGNNPHAIQYVCGRNPSKRKAGVYADREGNLSYLSACSAYDRKLFGYVKIADTWEDLYRDEEADE